MPLIDNHLSCLFLIHIRGYAYIYANVQHQVQVQLVACVPLQPGLSQPEAAFNIDLLQIRPSYTVSPYPYRCGCC